MDVDVLAVQEVEHIGILKQFNRENLKSHYRYQNLIEGNDPKFIDVGILFKLPIGAVTSFQTAVNAVSSVNFLCWISIQKQIPPIYLYLQN